MPHAAFSLPADDGLTLQCQTWPGLARQTVQRSNFQPATLYKVTGLVARAHKGAAR